MKGPYTAERQPGLLPKYDILHEGHSILEANLAAADVEKIVGLLNGAYRMGYLDCGGRFEVDAIKLLAELRERF